MSCSSCNKINSSCNNSFEKLKKARNNLITLERLTGKKETEYLEGIDEIFRNYKNCPDKQVIISIEEYIKGEYYKYNKHK